MSDRAKERGKHQLGTVGSGNHFVEVGYVAERFDDGVADRLGLGAGTVTVFIHSGSRGLGYQVCDDYLDAMGLIDLKKSGEGVVGKTTMISLPGIPAKVLSDNIESTLKRRKAM